MPVTFDNTRVYDRGRTTDMETLFRVYGNWGGIHDYQFDHAFLAHEVELVDGEWSAFKLFSFPAHDIIIDFITNVFAQGVILRYDPIENTGLIVGIEDDATFVVYDYDDGNLTLLHRRPIEWAGTFQPSWAETTLPYETLVRYAYRIQRFSSDESDVWESVSLWIGDKLMATFVHYLGAMLDTVTYAGLTTYEPGVYLPYARVPGMNLFAEWASLDPGEPPIGGLQRTTEGRHLKYFIRWNGAMRAWRSGQSTPIRHIYNDAEEVYSAQRSYDPRQLFNHIRMLGAYVQAEFVRGDLVGKQGHRFKEANNPYLMSTSECLIEAEAEIRRSIENATTETLETPVRPLLEPEDRIQTADGYRYLTRRQWDFTPSTITETIDTRMYAYEENLEDLD